MCQRGWSCRSINISDDGYTSGTQSLYFLWDSDSDSKSDSVVRKFGLCTPALKIWTLTPTLCPKLDSDFRT